MAGSLRILVAVMAWGTASFAIGQVGDPTRPPVGWLSVDDGAAASVSSGNEFRLQSVMLPQRGKPSAIIGGQSVVLGEKIGEAKLVRLTEKEAVLQGPDGVTRLYLTPDVNKQMIVTPKARKTGKSGQVKDLP